MNESRAIIERIRRINADYQYIELAVDDAAIKKIKPGESALMRRIRSIIARDSFIGYRLLVCGYWLREV